MGTDMLPDETVLTDLVKVRMPFGKYKGVLLYELPEPYLVWFHQKGLPKGRLGMLLSTLYEIKLNGLEAILAPLVKARPTAASRPSPRATRGLAAAVRANPPSVSRTATC